MVVWALNDVLTITSFLQYHKNKKPSLTTSFYSNLETDHEQVLLYFLFASKPIQKINVRLNTNCWHTKLTYKVKNLPLNANCLLCLLFLRQRSMLKFAPTKTQQNQKHKNMYCPFSFIRTLFNYLSRLSSKLLGYSFIKY